MSLRNLTRVLVASAIVTVVLCAPVALSEEVQLEQETMARGATIGAFGIA